MHSYTLPRLLLVGFLFALIAASGIHYKAAAQNSGDWTQTMSGEDEFVQACKGFDITTSYTSNLAYHVIENHSGDPVVERVNVSFAGALTNAKNGQSLPYDGTFTRTSDYHIGRVTVTDLELRIQLPTPGDWTVKIEQQDMDLLANPVSVIQTVAKTQLESGICVMLGRWANSDDLGRAPYGESVNVHTENSALPAPVATDDDMTNWAELDPCDSSPPGKPC
jgi:hypothetical protein